MTSLFIGSSSMTQQWQTRGEGSYRVVSDCADMVFDVAGASHSPGTPTICFGTHGGPNQQFQLEYSPGGPPGDLPQTCVNSPHPLQTGCPWWRFGVHPIGCIND